MSAPAKRSRFRAAFTSRSCKAPQPEQARCLIPRSAIPLGPPMLFAFGADLGRKRFVDDCEGCAVPQGLIAEHLSEQRPGRIQNGFCHPPLGQTKSVHVTDDDAAMLTHKPPRLLMQEVSPAISHFGMQRSCASFFVQVAGLAPTASHAVDKRRAS